MPLYWAGLWEAVNIAAGRVELAGGEVDEVGRGQAEVDDVEALATARPRRRRPASSTPGRPHVAADEHPAWPRRCSAANRAKAAPMRPAQRRRRAGRGTVPRMS